MDLLVHTSLRNIGALASGPRTLLRALRLATGPDATLVVPTQTPQNSFSSRTFVEATAALEPAELDLFVAAMPGFDPALTPSVGMGAFAEYVRTRRGARRSGHPQSSLAAVGPGAAACTAVHRLDCHFGDASPLKWLYDRDAWILLLGVDFSVCTAFHLAEYRIGSPTREYRCFVMHNDVRRECVYVDVELDDRDFGALGTQLENERTVHRGRVGRSASRLLPLRMAVDFATERLPVMRARVSADNPSV
jgi:aminoglycoside 3-N-acetyltransferase